MSEPRSRPTRRDLLAAAGGLAVAPLAAAAAPAAIAAPRRVLRLAHLTDVHVQPERRGAEGFAAALRHAQSHADPPELILFGGDNVMNVDGDGRERAGVQLATWRDVVRLECGLPHEAVIGNHDVLAMHPVDGKRWAMDAYGLTARYRTFVRSGWRFLLLDSTTPKPDGGYEGRLDPEQRAWLEATLRETPATTPICIVSHIPILAACTYFDGDNEDSGDWRVPAAWMHIDARELKDLFRRHPNVRLCLSGHVHLADVVSYLGVTYACNGAVSGGWWDGAYQEFGPAYALVDLYEDGSHRVEMVETGWT